MLEHAGAWSNTGYMLLEIHPLANSLTTARSTAESAGSEARNLGDFTIFVKTVNNRDHLLGLKRTGGGVGSSKFDDGQKTMESFFKKRRV